MKTSEELSTDQASQFAKEINRTGIGDGQALPPSCPLRGSSAEPERPLSNKLILGRDGRKIGSRSTGGSIEIYPSMLVRKRDYTEMEDDYYAMVARFGKKSRVGGSIRGKIDHFSDAARFRMLKVLGKIGREDPPYMVTLTYRSGSVTFDQAKKDLKNFGKRLNRQFGITHETIEEFTNFWLRVLIYLEGFTSIVHHAHSQKFFIFVQDKLMFFVAEQAKIPSGRFLHCLNCHNVMLHPFVNHA